jgi:hypothetical protein
MRRFGATVITSNDADGVRVAGGHRVGFPALLAVTSPSLPALVVAW